METVSQKVQYASARHKMPAHITRKHNPKARSRNGDFLAFLGQKTGDAVVVAAFRQSAACLQRNKITGFLPKAATQKYPVLLLHADAIEKRAVADRIGVRETRRVRLPDDIALDGRKGRLRSPGWCCFAGNRSDCSRFPSLRPSPPDCSWAQAATWPERTRRWWDSTRQSNPGRLFKPVPSKSA